MSPMRGPLPMTGSTCSGSGPQPPKLATAAHEDLGDLAPQRLRLLRRSVHRHDCDLDLRQVVDLALVHPACAVAGRLARQLGAPVNPRQFACFLDTANEPYEVALPAVPHARTDLVVRDAEIVLDPGGRQREACAS